jgi:hypothetical protein
MNPTDGLYQLGELLMFAKVKNVMPEASCLSFSTVLD